LVELSELSLAFGLIDRFGFGLGTGVEVSVSEIGAGA
jgi:hypothetical protein